MIDTDPTPPRGTWFPPASDRHGRHAERKIRLTGPWRRKYKVLRRRDRDARSYSWIDLYVGSVVAMQRRRRGK